MSYNKNDKPVVLVTGGSRGIGFGICEKLASEGYDIAICGRSAPGDVTRNIALLEKAGGEILYVQADIGIPSDRGRLIEAIRKRFGRLDVLVNNVGMAPRERCDILEASEESYDEVMTVNLKGPYFLTQLVAGWMVEQLQEGRERSAEQTGQSFSIIFISSISSTVASPSRGEYCISKAGLSMAAQLWAVRLAEFGINVNEIRPGVISAGMAMGVKDKYDKLIEDGLTLQPRWGTTEELGKAVASLAKGDWSYSTGQVFFVDGGMTVGRL